MSYPNPATALARVIVDELVRAGAGLVLASSGSRSTALVLAVAGRTDLELVMALDERSAAFQALGWAKATGRPGTVVTTSGTAVANLGPAVVEADAAGVPLIALTADRPHSLRGVGANQTIDQSGMFDRFVRGSFELYAAVEADAPRWWRSVVAQAAASARGSGGRPGPVQVNVSFAEPTVPVTDDGRTRAEPYPYDLAGREAGEPWSQQLPANSPGAEAVRHLVALLERTDQGLIVAGSGVDGAIAVAELGVHLGWPVVATAESGLRGSDGVISTGHHILGDDRATPELVLRLGGPGPSRRLVDLVTGPATQVVVGPGWSDPGRRAALLIGGDPGEAARAVIDSTAGRDPGEWERWWLAADEAVRAALEPHLDAVLTEPAVAAAAGKMPSERLVVASSMPIRDVEAYAFELPPVIANRGASGIDGFVSLALGAARLEGETLALAGDLSLLHDSNGFVSDSRPACVFVVVDNSGGGIFSFLPQAEHVGPEFDRLFGTPPERDLGTLAALHGLSHRSVENPAELKSAVVELRAEGGIGLVVARTDRLDNVAEHRRLESVAFEAVASTPR